MQLPYRTFREISGLRYFKRKDICSNDFFNAVAIQSLFFKRKKQERMVLSSRYEWLINEVGYQNSLVGLTQLVDILKNFCYTINRNRKEYQS